MMIIHLFLGAKRKFSTKSVSFDHSASHSVDCGSLFGPSASQNLVILPQNVTAVTPLRRSSRISKPVNRINIGLITCFICKKIFWNDVSMMQNMGPVACSVECFKQAQ